MKWVVSLWSFLMMGSVFAQGDCVPSMDNCDYYLCKESQKGCGPRGYFLNFGYRYCYKISRSEQKKLYSDDGVRWLSETRLCLQQKIEEMDQNISCKKIKKAAVDHHVDCYVKHGFCELARRDKRFLKRAIADSYFRLGMSLPAYFKTLKYCGLGNTIF